MTWQAKQQQFAAMIALAVSFGASAGPLVEITQLSWLAPDETVILPFSNYGQLHLTLPEPDPDDLLWLNATIDGQWAIQNQPLIEIDGEGSIQNYTYPFAFNVPPGHPVKSVLVVVDITPFQLADPPQGDPTTVSVLEHLYSPGAGLGEPNELPQPHLPAIAQNVSNPPVPVTWEKVRRRSVPGIAEQHNHCTPGAFARSLAWMNTHYCLNLPADNNDVTEIYNKLKNNDHMMTTKEGGTRWWGRPADDSVNCDDPFWGKMMAGLNKFIADKNLGGKLMVECNQFKKQDADNPAFNPCDVFEALEQGKDVIVQIGYWPNDETLDNTVRDNGHSITVVGAVKCGEEVTIYYRDDCNGRDSQNNLDQDGDNNADSGVKSAKFVAGGASGWKVLGERWEGFIAICPKPLVQVQAIAKHAIQAAIKLTQAANDLNNGQEPPPALLADILKLAKTIEDISCSLVNTTQALDPPCPDALTIAQRLKSKAIMFRLLAEFLVERPSLNTIDEMNSLLDEMEQQNTDLGIELRDCLCPADVSPPPFGDGKVDINDLFLVLAQWGSGGPEGDINNDGIVNIDDLFLVIASWGPCP